MPGKHTTPPGLRNCHSGSDVLGKEKFFDSHFCWLGRITIISVEFFKNRLQAHGVIFFNRRTNYPGIHKLGLIRLGLQ